MGECVVSLKPVIDRHFPLLWASWLFAGTDEGEVIYTESARLKYFPAEIGFLLVVRTVKLLLLTLGFYSFRNRRELTFGKVYVISN